MTRTQRYYALVALALLPATAAPATPLELRNSHADLRIGGGAHIAAYQIVTTNPQDATYTGSTSVDRFKNDGANLSQNVSVDLQPALAAGSKAGSMAGVQFKMVAENEYVIDLSGVASGECRLAESFNSQTGRYDSMAHTNVNAQFLIKGLPGQGPTSPATVVLQLEHVGTLSTVNNGSASSVATVGMSVSGSQQTFSYSKMLTSPYVSAGDFTETQVIATRSYSTVGVLTTSVGQTITLNAALDASTKGALSYPYSPAYLVSGASADFDSGLRLHLTVLPEPATLLPMLLGAVLLRRRRAFERG